MAWAADYAVVRAATCLLVALYRLVLPAHATAIFVNILVVRGGALMPPRRIARSLTMAGDFCECSRRCARFQPDAMIGVSFASVLPPLALIRPISGDGAMIGILAIRTISPVTAENTARRPPPMLARHQRESDALSSRPNAIPRSRH